MKTSSRLFVQVAREETIYPNCLLYQARESVRLIALTTSLKVWRKSYPTIFFFSSLFSMSGALYPRDSCFIFTLPHRNSSTRHCTVISFTVSSPNVILLLRAASAGLWSSLNS